MANLPVSNNNVGDVNDLATLAKLDDKILLQQLKARYERDKIYTYVGDILVSVNPFKDLGIYGQDAVQRYRMQKISDQPPHIFAVADRCYQNIVGGLGETRESQCVLISGESGAGKTECTKLIIKQLIQLCHGNSQLEQQILQVNPLLEAFGNARTTMNDNSSRFGKYILLKFHDGKVLGAKISEYLLEKSRMVRQNEGEGNFHIFSYMSAGVAGGGQTFQLQPLNQYKYLSNGVFGSMKNVVQLKERYDELINAMDMVGFTDQEQEDMFAILSATLTMGNIDVNLSESGDATVAQSGPELKVVADLLGLNGTHALHVCVTVHESFARGELIRKNYTQAQALDSRDAIAKALYGRLFSWIVNKINSLLVETEPHSPQLIQEIGILDIFGFEHFTVNSFEQACINLANEQLQFFFNKHIFSLEQDEYKGEGIDWKEIKFVDNQPLLDLFLGKPIGILTLLDEESLFPNGTDESFVSKMDHRFSDEKHYIKSAQADSAMFTIAHYAGKVTYTSAGWLEKNRDTLPPGVMHILQGSANRLLNLIFKGQISRTGTLALNCVLSQKPTRHKAQQAANETKGRKLTVGHQFKNSLNVLMERMTKSRPVFIRCLKPNSKNVAKSFDDQYVTAQLLYTGMLETTKIRREGFAVRPRFAEFVDRYKILILQHQFPATAQSCRQILAVCKIEGWHMGKTKVFLKYWHIDQLSDLLLKMAKSAVHMQRVVRGFLARRRVKAVLLEAIRRAQLAAELCRLVETCNTNSFSRQMALTQADVLIPREYFVLNKDSEVAPSILESGYLLPLSSDRKTQPKRSGVVGAMSGSTQTPSEAESRIATTVWFKATQHSSLKRPDGAFVEWFHGIIPRIRAEQMLKNKPVGCFLVRVSESRFGYSLSFLAERRCRHYMISQLTNGKFIVVGENKAHRSLVLLVDFLHKNRLSNWDGLLTVPCGQEAGECDYADLLDNQIYIDIDSASMRQSTTDQRGLKQRR